MATPQLRNLVTIFAPQPTASTPPGGAYQTLRRRPGGGIAPNKGTAISEELSSDPQVRSIAEVSFDTPIEYTSDLSISTAELGVLVANALRTTVVAVNETDTDFSITGNNTLTRTADHEAALIAATAVGKLIKIAGFTSTNNNGVFKIAAVTDNKNLLLNSINGASAGVTNEAVGDTVTVVMNNYRNGSTDSMLAFEERVPDATAAEFIRSLGAEVVRFGVEIPARELCTVTYGLQAIETTTQSATDAASVVASNSHPSLNGTTNVPSGGLYEAGTALTLRVRSLSFELDNNPATPGALSSKYPVDVAKGQAVLTGTIDAYFESDALLTKALNHTATSIQIRLNDADGGVIVFTIPRVFLKPSALTDADNLISTPLEFDACADSTTNTTLQVDIFPGA